MYVCIHIYIYIYIYTHIGMSSSAAPEGSRYSKASDAGVRHRLSSAACLTQGLFRSGEYLCY